MNITYSMFLLSRCIYAAALLLFSQHYFIIAYYLSIACIDLSVLC